MITRITGNGDDVWQLLGLTFQSFHLRMGTLDTMNMLAIEIGVSIQDERIIELTKELAMPTALVTPHAFSCWVAMANLKP